MRFIYAMGRHTFYADGFEYDVMVLMRDFKQASEDESLDVKERDWARGVLATLIKGKMSRAEFIRHAERLDEI